MIRPLRTAMLVALACTLAACGGRDRPQADLAASQVTTIGVNSYLWRASLDALSFVASCMPVSAAIFVTYALAFSTGTARRAYRAGERGIHALLAGVFAVAGVRLLLSGPR